MLTANSRLGRKPGDPRSTDPQALVRQPYTNEKPTGGFLHVAVQPGADGSPPKLVFTLYDEFGVALYSHADIATAR